MLDASLMSPGAARCHAAAACGGRAVPHRQRLPGHEAELARLDGAGRGSVTERHRAGKVIVVGTVHVQWALLSACLISRSSSRYAATDRVLRAAQAEMLYFGMVGRKLARAVVLLQRSVNVCSWCTVST